MKKLRSLSVCMALIMSAGCLSPAHLPQSHDPNPVRRVAENTKRNSFFWTAFALAIPYSVVLTAKDIVAPGHGDAN
ncbi:MAG: hypothetical protein U0744_10400 [Gemmataceae bacterium]